MHPIYRRTTLRRWLALDPTAKDSLAKDSLAVLLRRSVGAVTVERATRKIKHTPPRHELHIRLSQKHWGERGKHTTKMVHRALEISRRNDLSIRALEISRRYDSSIGALEIPRRDDISIRALEISRRDDLSIHRPVARRLHSPPPPRGQEQKISFGVRLRGVCVVLSCIGMFFRCALRGTRGFQVPLLLSHQTDQPRVTLLVRTVALAGCRQGGRQAAGCSSTRKGSHKKSGRVSPKTGPGTSLGNAMVQGYTTAVIHPLTKDKPQKKSSLPSPRDGQVRVLVTL